jgi:hypothetical protein
MVVEQIQRNHLKLREVKLQSMQNNKLNIMLRLICKNFLIYRYVFFFLQNFNKKLVTYLYNRSYTITLLNSNNYFFIHRGYIFVYRYVYYFHQKQKFGNLAITRKLLNKGIKNNK